MPERQLGRGTRIRTAWLWHLTLSPSGGTCSVQISSREDDEAAGLSDPDLDDTIVMRANDSNRE